MTPMPPLPRHALRSLLRHLFYNHGMRSPAPGRERQEIAAFCDARKLWPLVELARRGALDRLGAPEPPLAQHLVPPRKPIDFFICYPTINFDHARAIYDGLAARSFQPFLDRLSLASGALWMTEIPEALARSQRIVLIVSRHSHDAWYQQCEVVDAIERIRRREMSGHIVLLEARDQLTIPYGLAVLHAVALPDLGTHDAVVEKITADWRQ